MLLYRYVEVMDTQKKIKTYWPGKAALNDSTYGELETKVKALVKTKVKDVDSSKLIPVISFLNLSSLFLCPCGYYENYVARSMMCMQIWCTKSVLYVSY